MHRMRVFVCALFFAASAFAQDARIRAFEQFAEETMKAQKMPGLSVAVMHGDFRWSRGFGFSDVENEVPARADSSYRMASVTKPMTAVAVLKLVEEGKIDLDAEVQTYVPYFPRKAHKVTVRQLLAHQGGISHYRDYDKEGHIRERKTTREAIAIFEDFDLVAEPGTAYRYSSYGYNLLGAVIEGASGQSFGEAMTETVWKPLGMNATRMDDPRALVPHRVVGYALDDDGKLQRSEYIDISSRFAGGGTRSTVEDMIRFVEGLGDGKVLKSETRDRAWTAEATRNGRYTNYGYGFGVVSMSGRFGVEHGGAQQETRTNLLYLPRERFAVALASNFENASLWPFQQKLVSLFLRHTREVSARSNDDAITTTFGAMEQAFTYGLAYYDRHGKAMTSDPRELAKAFQYFRNATRDKKLVEDGRHPVAGEPLTIVGSHIASVLAANGKLDAYHREGALRFFADYARTPKSRLGKALATQVTQWNAEWPKLWTPELQAIDLTTAAGLDALEKHRATLVAASLKPDLAGELIDLVEDRARARDLANAMRAATMGVELYPRSAGTNGAYGVLLVMSGDVARGRSHLAKSVEIDPRAYASMDNLRNIANFLSRSDNKEAADALLQIATELHPSQP